MKNGAVRKAVCLCLDSILLDFLKIREEISVPVHILGNFLELLKPFFFFF